MSKIYQGIFLSIGFILTFHTYAYVGNISNVGPAYTNSILSGATCDEILTNDLYLGQGAILVDSFRNQSSHDIYIQGSAFALDGRLGTDGNPLCVYNNSEYKPGDFRMLSFNKPYLDSIGRKIVPNGFIRHLTTNQEYGLGWQNGIWTFSGSHTNTHLPGNFTFNQTNVRNTSNRPLTLATGSTYDCQVKMGTIYDSDDNMATTSDNEMLVECQRYQIRWCGDGIKQTNESCEPNDTSKSGWGTLGCSAACQPLNPSGGGGGGGGGGSSGGGSSGGGGGSSSYCGDGGLQRPNSKAQFEECDFGSSTTWPSWCSKTDCKIRGDNTTPSEGGGDNTIPSEKDGLIFYPSGGAILGDNMGLFATYNLEKPYIKNNTGYDLYIEKPLCLYKENKSSLLGVSAICSSQNIGELLAGEKFQINTGDYIAKTDNVLGSFESVKLFTAPEGLQTTYLSSTLKVIVAKSSVASIAGGTSLLNYNASYYSDVDIIAQNFLTDLRNKNFVVTSLSQNSGFSSYVNKIENKSLYDSSIADFNDSTSNVSNIGIDTYASTIYSLPTQKYNGLPNVFIHKGDLVLNGQAIMGGRTYIIESGNLYINGDINVISGNLAFVVKGGNIIIANSVTGLEGVYLSIGGKINSDGIKTNNRLLVNGGIYGDARDLFANRTYMKSDNGIINVGTVVNFKSSVFDNPPPLLTGFVDEYMKVAKIAK